MADNRRDDEEEVKFEAITEDVRWYPVPLRLCVRPAGKLVALLRIVSEFLASLALCSVAVSAPGSSGLRPR